MAQAIHAFREFIDQHPEDELDWYQHSNYICVLHAKNQEHLEKLMAKAVDKSILHAPFFEPDLDNELTAVAFAPCHESKRLLRSLRLAG